MKNTLNILIVSSVFVALMLCIGVSYPLFAHADGCNYTNTGWYAVEGYYNIGSSFGPNGCISATGVVNKYYLLPSGFSSFTLDIKPNDNYQVADVLVDNVSVGAVTTYTFPSITADRTISATFKAGSETTHTITVSSGPNGSFGKQGGYVYNSSYPPQPFAGMHNGESLTFEFIPASGYQVADVLVDGSSVGAVTTYTFTNITADHTISATFAINPNGPSTHIITSTGTLHGSTQTESGSCYTVNGAGFFLNNGCNITFDFVPDSGYHVAGVLVDGNSVGAVTTYAFTNVTVDHTISVTFAINTGAPGTPDNAPGAIGSIISDSGPILPNTQGSNNSDSGPILPNTQGSNNYEGSVVTDATPPVISGTSADISATTSNAVGVVVNYTLPTATDAVDGARPVACTPASGSVFPIGTTIVTCESKDSHSNTATTTFKVIVTLASTPVVVPVVPVVPVIVSGGSSFSSFSSSGSYYGGSSIIPSPVPPLAIATAPITSATTSCPLITSYLKLGARNDGSQVAKLQIFLKNSQHLNVDVTGIFDQKTFVAVKAFQSRYLSDVLGPWTATIPSGYVYITTSKKINEIACNSPLTLSRSDLAIINAYIINRDNAAAGIVGPAAPGTPFTPGTLNASTTPLTPEIGQNTTTGTANTASVVNASIFQRFWNFIKSLF